MVKVTNGDFMVTKKKNEKQDEEITDLRINMAQIQTDLEYTKKKIDEIDSKIDEFIKCADDKYAPHSIIKKVQEHDKKIGSIKLTMAKWAGALIVIIAIVQMIIGYFI